MVEEAQGTERSMLSSVPVLGDRSQFLHDTPMAPTSSTSPWGSRSNGTSRQCTAHWFVCSGHPETLPLPWGDEETGCEALRLVPTPSACVHVLLPWMPGTNPG